MFKQFVFLFLLISCVFCSEDTKESSVVYFYYSSVNCTETSLYQISYYDGCNPFSRVEVNSTSVLQYKNDEESVSICTGDYLVSENLLNKCITRGQDDKFSIKIEKYDQNNHSHIFNMSGSVQHSIFPFSSCEGNRYVNIMFLDKVYNNDGIYEFKNKTSDGKIETFDCDGMEKKNCKRSDLQKPEKCLLKNGFYFSFSFIESIKVIEKKSNDSKPETNTQAQNTSRIANLLDPQKNKAIPSVFYDFTFLLSIVFVVIVIL